MSPSPGSPPCLDTTPDGAPKPGDHLSMNDCYCHCHKGRTWDLFWVGRRQSKLRLGRISPENTGAARPARCPDGRNFSFLFPGPGPGLHTPFAEGKTSRHSETGRGKPGTQGPWQRQGCPPQGRVGPLGGWGLACPCPSALTYGSCFLLALVWETVVAGRYRAAVTPLPPPVLGGQDLGWPSGQLWAPNSCSGE